MKFLWFALLVMGAATAQAVELQLPTGARQMITRDTVQDRFFVPVAPFAEGTLPTRIYEGTINRSAWRIDVAGLTPLQLVKPLRAQLVEAGYTVVLDCAARDCGGYDFRFAAEVLPAPNMYVNIRNFHVLSATRGGVEAVNILASASSGASFVQIIQVGTEESEVVANAAPFPVPVRAPAGSIAQALVQNGHVVLEGLEFESGMSELSEGVYPALEELADAMLAQPEMRVALVGHTDNVGSLDGNKALSLSRANAVRDSLVRRYDIAVDRIETEGTGYLSPLTTNLTEAGREANRRVEVVVLVE